MEAGLLRARLERHPREQLAHLPTPLQPMPRLTAALGGPPLWVKRDDCTGLATGGNKTRKLEFLMGAARAAGADAVITFGALQSNHARQTAAAAAALGLGCDLILVDSVPYREPAYTVSGNLLLDDLLGARVHRVADESAAAQTLAQLLASARAEDRAPYVIPIGGSSAIGALGYVGCALELAEQIEAISLEVGSIVHATSSTGTQAGLAVGLSAVAPGLGVCGVNVYARDAARQAAELRQRCDETAALLDVEPPADAALVVDSDHLGPGYGVPTPATLEALELVARHEGILLDPVYTGKAMAALIAAVRAGRLPRDRAVVFVHTGGSVGLFAYREAIAKRSPA